MSDRITAPWTETQIAALNAFQRSGVMHPFTCGNDEHRMRPTLIAEHDGWHCPDETCDYRQNWAHAFMAGPTTPGRLQASLPGFLAVRQSGDPMATELAKVRRQLRATEDDLAKTREQLTAALLRIQALQVHEAICRVEAAIPAPAAPPCGETLYERPIADVPTGGHL